MPAGTWATDLWNSIFCVRITSGAQSGKISIISATTATQITFALITGLSGTPTFEIRQLKYEATGSLRIGTTTVTYTGFLNETTFSGCSGTPAASSGDSVAQYITEYKGAPRGNILLVMNTRMFVAGVAKSPASIYYSDILDATDFTFSSPRVADEGGVINLPDGGYGITGMGIQENVIYAMKEDVIYTISFTQDENDFPVIQPLLRGVGIGPLGKDGVFNVENELYYVSKDGNIRSVTRSNVVQFPQTSALSDRISGYMDTLTLDGECRTMYFKRKAYIALKRGGALHNNIVLAYNFEKQAWEAPIVGWTVGSFAEKDGVLHWGNSYTAETWFVSDDLFADDSVPFVAVARFAYDNGGKAANLKEFDTMFLEGYISENTTITIKQRYNYLGGQETRTSTLSGSEDTYIVSQSVYNVLGNDILGDNPLAIVVTEDDVLTDLLKFRVYFKTSKTPYYEMSLEISSEDAGAQWELLRYGTNALLLPTPQQTLYKKLA
jgi:hypothetical protein